MIVADMSEANAMASELNQKGIRFVQKNQMQHAEKMFEQATHVDPSFGQAYNNLGLVYYHQHDFFEAAQVFAAAIDHLPESPEPLNNLGLVMESVARPVDAMALYQQAHELAPTNADYLGNLLRARIRNDVCDDELLSQLHALLLYEKRTEWQDWAREQLALIHNLELDRGPSKPASESLDALKSGGNDASKESRSATIQLGSPSNPIKPPTKTETDLTLPQVIPEELPKREMVPQLPKNPIRMTPTPAPVPSSAPTLSYPQSLPPPVRAPSSILEPLE